MIQEECFEKEWIDKVCSTHKFCHPELVEKVIRAFSLLEMLVKEGCPLTFKGGTSLLLILGEKARRLSKARTTPLSTLQSNYTILEGCLMPLKTLPLRQKHSNFVRKKNCLV